MPCPSTGSSIPIYSSATTNLTVDFISRVISFGPKRRKVPMPLCASAKVVTCSFLKRWADALSWRSDDGFCIVAVDLNTGLWRFPLRCGRSISPLACPRFERSSRLASSSPVFVMPSLRILLFTGRHHMHNPTGWSHPRSVVDAVRLNETVVHVKPGIYELVHDIRS